MPLQSTLTRSTVAGRQEASGEGRLVLDRARYLAPKDRVFDRWDVCAVLSLSAAMTVATLTARAKTAA